MADELQSEEVPVVAEASQESSTEVDTASAETGQAEAARLESEKAEATEVESARVAAPKNEVPKPVSKQVEAPKMEEHGVDELLDDNSQTEVSKESADSGTQVVAEAAAFPSLESGPVGAERDRKMDLLLDLTLPVAIELGRTNLQIRDILDLRRGSVVEFEKLASEPVDVIVNGKKMAEGEVVVIEKHFGIRITNLIETSERVKSLGK